ncbi:OST3 [Candida oxycetoniae]|uniref:OST3 n=1 Tax=Candida oxycetoniae TaxID=497107 RepID=A0AAI9SXU8_9ASCO|nr:OST3 [Candida oxycetoniae]KAI3404736.2 OST3 [Candida oxycetoniae]
MKVSVAFVFAFLYTLVNCALSNDQLFQAVKKSKGKLLPLNDENYENILNGQRDYHIIVFFTTDAPQINCVLCRDIAPEIQLIANSWVKDHPNGVVESDESEQSKNVYFFKSDFVDSKKLFQLFQMNNIPKIFHFRPTKALGPNNFLREKKEYQFFQGDQKGLMMSWVQEMTGHRFNLHIPINKNRVIFNMFVAFFTTILLKKFRKQIGKILASKITWGVFSLLAVLLFTTGFMFNKIRHTPYIIDHADGKIEYFMRAQQNQLGIETQIISFVYGVLSILVVILVKKAPEIKTPSINLVLVAIVCGLIFILFSLLLSFFGLKTAGFPYRFIRFF